MTKERWLRVWDTEVYKLIPPMGLGPKDWADYKVKVAIFVAEMDRATEVYNLENGIKETK